MDYATLMQSGGHAQQHATKAMQETCARLLDLCEADVESALLGSDDEANDWNRQCLVMCGGDEIKTWIELSSDLSRPGEYRFRCLATLNSVAVDVGFSDPAWTDGTTDAGVDGLIAQLTAIELATVTIARTIQHAMHEV